MTGSRSEGTPPSPQFCNSTTSRGGAPKGNRNALKHGAYTKAMLHFRKDARLQQRKMLAMVAQVNALLLTLPSASPRRSSQADSEAPARLSGASPASANRAR